MTDMAVEVVVIGASAGALDALSVVLPTLPKSYPRAVLVVVHIPADKRSVLVELFKQRCKVEVREAEDKEPIESGTIYFAPPDYHLLVEKDKTLSLSIDEPVLFSRPSIDVLFESAAEAYGPSLVSVVLTGANRDGADGIKAVTKAGGTAIIQDPEEAFAATMPEAALVACPGARVMSLIQIAAYLEEV
jgi:two-component system, chemotaxis family, protein-glutamate methylesterase/glutaminase